MARAPLIALLLGCHDGSLPEPPKGELEFVLGTGGSAQAHRLDLGSGERAALAPAPSFPYGRTPVGDTVLVVRDGLFRLGRRGLVPISVSAGADWRPQLHPVEPWVLFESSRASFRALYLAPIAGGPAERLTFAPEGDFDGAWSPSGDRICFSSSRHGQLDLFVLDTESRRPTRWTVHPGDAVRCAFSPSGRWVAYRSARDGREGVLAVSGPGTEPIPLTSDVPLGEAGPFVWHPVEDRLAVAVGDRVFVLGPHISPVSLTPEGVRDAEPAWSPDGSWLAVNRRGQGPPGVWAIEVSTGRSTPLAENLDAWRIAWHRSRKEPS